MRKLKPVINQSFQSIISLKSNQSTVPTTVQSMGRADSDYGLISRHLTAVEPTTRRSGVQVSWTSPSAVWWGADGWRYGVEGWGVALRSVVSASRHRAYCAVWRVRNSSLSSLLMWVEFYVIYLSVVKRSVLTFFPKVGINLDQWNLRYFMVLLLKRLEFYLF